VLLPVITLTGCVSNKYKAASALGSQPQRIDMPLGGDAVGATLNAVVVYKGPGSWKQEAYWDELLVTLHNRTARDLTITGAAVADRHGARMAAGSDPWALEKASVDQRKRYQSAGVSFALNTVGYAALTYGAVGAGAIVGAALTSSWAGLGAGATVGLAAVPVTAIVVYAKNQKNKHAIEAEFARRRLAFPLVLKPGESRTGSLFFPMSVSPAKLSLDLLADGATSTIDYPTPMLAGLHEPASSAKK
jgi:hypothetical protein